MDTTLFSQINTTISVKDREFLTAGQFQQLLQAKDLEAVALVLQPTIYALTPTELADLDVIESTLMKQLAATYQTVYAETPVPEVVDIFSLKYTYHNLKVLLKEKATQTDLHHLLLPIGRYDVDILSHLVATMTAEHCPAFMQEELLSTWTEYQDYQDIRVLEIGMDLAYFKHLQRLKAELDHPVLSQLIDLVIEFYNITTVKRAVIQDQPHSFMRQLLSESGRFSAQDYMTWVKQDQLAVWFNQINPAGFDLDLRSYEEKMLEGRITVKELEDLKDQVKASLLSQGRYTSEGPLALARFLWGKELEVKNLRLVLTAHVNQIPMTLIEERMRPIYD